MPSSEELPKTAARSRPELFPRTAWTELCQAARSSESQSFPSIARLCARYRAPLLQYLIWQSGRERAEDILQDFLVKMANPRFYAALVPEKGRFRSFLLVCLRNHLRDEIDRQQAARRGGGRPALSLDARDANGRTVCEVPAGPCREPGEEFDRAWARAVFHRAWTRLAEEGRRQGKTALVEAARPLILGQIETNSIASIAKTIGLTENAMAVALHRLKHRLGELVRREVRATVASQTDWEDEVRYLVHLLGDR